jgi:hypothetical protein
MATQIVQARITDSALEQLSADADALGLESTSAALREGIELLHRKAEQVRLAQAYDDFYGGAAAPVGDAAQALWGREE